RTQNAWTPDLLHSEQVTQNRRAELGQIKSYVEHDGCLMEFLARALDDLSPARCGKCMNCTGQTQRQTPPTELIQKAVEYLRGDAVVIEPRKQWPAAVLGQLQ